jgi:hypothetical protein
LEKAAKFQSSVCRASCWREVFQKSEHGGQKIFIESNSDEKLNQTPKVGITTIKVKLFIELQIPQQTRGHFDSQPFN